MKTEIVRYITKGIDMGSASNNLTAVMALKEMIDMWTRLAERPYLDKDDIVRGYTELKHMVHYKHRCSLCEYAAVQRDSGVRSTDCTHCLIWDTQWGCEGKEDSPYRHWNKSKFGSDERVIYAQEMVALAQETLDFLLSLGYTE